MQRCAHIDKQVLSVKYLLVDEGDLLCRCTRIDKPALISLLAVYAHVDEGKLICPASLCFLHTLCIPVLRKLSRLKNYQIIS